jgi:hypothetical protein
VEEQTPGGERDRERGEKHRSSSRHRGRSSSRNHRDRSSSRDPRDSRGMVHISFRVDPCLPSENICAC